MKRLFLLVLVVLFAFGSLAAAQSDSGLIGVVRDSQGGLLPGVTVAAIGPSGTRNITTDQQGAYRIVPLLPGSYHIRFELSGFRIVESTGQVAARGTTAIDAKLDVALVESVTVTAQRREEDLQRVPLAITALNSQAIERSGIVDISRLQFAAPGINIGRAGEDVRPAIRGARTEQVGAVNDPTVGFHIDGIYQSRPSQAVNGFVDVERVEVQRGPQGTLFGRNTFGGNVHLVSKVPTRALDWGGNVTLGDYSRRKMEAFVNVPLNDKVQFRVAGNLERRAGYITNTGPAPDLWDEDLNFVRATVRIAPSNSLELLARLTHWDQGGNGQGDFGFVALGTVRDPTTGLWTLNGVLDPVSSRRGTLGSERDAPYSVNRDVPFTRDNKNNAGSLEATWRGRHVDVKSLTGFTKFHSFRQNDGDYSSNVHAKESVDENVRSATQEFQVSSSGQTRVSWVAGVFILDDHLTYEFLFNRMFLDVPGLPERATATTTTPNPNGLSQNLETLDTVSRAVFGQTTVGLAKNLRATLGGRWTRDEKIYSNLNQVTGLNTVGFGGAIAKDKSRSWTHGTWRASVDYQATPDNLVYGAVSTGFIAGGFAFAAPTLQYNPQSVVAYEVGSKNTFGPRAQLNISAYHNSFSDLLANAFTTDPVTGAVFTYQTNAGAVGATGVEVELHTAPVDALRVGLTLALQRAKYGQFILPNPFPRGGDATLPGNFVNLNGSQVALSPDARATVSASYDISTSAGKFTPVAQSYLSSSYSAWDVRIGRDGVNVQDAYTRTDLRLVWAPNNAHWRVQGYVENLENKAIILRALRGGDNFVQAVYAAPRTAGIRLSYEFR